MATVGRNDETMDPSTRVLTVLEQISERDCRTLSVSRSLTRVCRRKRKKSTLALRTREKIELDLWASVVQSQQFLRDDVFKLDREQEQEQDFYFSLHRSVILFLDEDFILIIRDRLKR